MIKMLADLLSFVNWFANTCLKHYDVSEDKKLRIEASRCFRPAGNILPILLILSKNLISFRRFENGYFSATVKIYLDFISQV